MKNNKIYKSLNKGYPYERGYCGCGKLTTSKKNDVFICKDCLMALEDKLPSEQQQILKELGSTKLTPEEVRSILKAKKVNVTSGKPYEARGNHVRFGVFGDSHIGHKCYDERLGDYAAKVFNKEKVDFVIHTGDICEGHYESKREGSVFELSHVGGDAQVKYAVEQLSKIKRPLLFITGNHETNTFFKMSGFDIGNQIAEKLPGSQYLGQGSGRVELPNGQFIEVMHPDGGSSYAISYKSQKIVESLEGGTKPAILLIGHFHKAEYLFYRNIHVFQTGTLCGQTPFMRGKNLAAHKGFWIVDAEVTKDGISSLAPKYYPAY